MLSIFTRNNWLLTKTILIISLLIPLGVVAFELLILGKNSVVLLGNYPSAIGILVLIYYSLLLLAGIGWIVVQLKSLVNLKNESRKNELLHLQSQVNPHFFFNMLNNLYGLVDKDAVKSKELILKLADLMRYSIYEGEKKEVSLKQEIDYLKNYVELHKMRYHKQIDVQFTVNVMNDDARIMPLLFIILLENAFKHGVENLRNNAVVNLELSEDNGVVSFSVENNYDEEQPPCESGIGLKNLKRRLELAYAKKHDLSFSKNNSVFKAQLHLRK